MTKAYHMQGPMARSGKKFRWPKKATEIEKVRSTFAPLELEEVGTYMHRGYGVRILKQGGGRFACEILDGSSDVVAQRTRLRRHQVRAYFEGAVSELFPVAGVTKAAPAKKTFVAPPIPSEFMGLSAQGIAYLR